MSLSFIHTSDWHLGRSYERLGPRSAEMRLWRFKAVRRVFELAVEHQAAFILVAGDVFQSETPRSAIVEDVVALMRDAPVPTIIISGNHDPLTEGSVWKRDDFAGALRNVENVVLALEPKPISIGPPGMSATLFPCPVTNKQCPEDISSWIPTAARGEGGYRIGLAHGGWQGYSGQSYVVNFIAADRAERAGLDYLALGDFHSYTLADHPAVKARCCYSGTTECTAVDEARAGYALAVTITEPGAVPQIVPHRVGRMRPVLLSEATLSPGAGFEQFKQQVESIQDAGDVLLGLRAAGVLNVEEYRDFTEWSNGLENRFLGIDRQFSQLFYEPSDADFEQLSLAPSERKVLELLRSGAVSVGADGGFPAASADVRRQAIAMYYAELKRGAEA